MKDLSLLLQLAANPWAQVPAAHCCLPCATAGRRCTDPKLPSIGEDCAVNKEHLQTVALPKYLGRGRAAKRSREAAGDVAALVQGARDMKIAEERA